MKTVAMILGVMFLSGCVVRTYTIQKPRQDLAIEGNQGYLVGTPKEHQKEPKETWPIRIFEIEFGASAPEDLELSPQEEKSLQEDLESTSYGKGVLEEEIYQEEATQEEVIPKEKLTTEPVTSPQYTMYTVQKNDTLQKISKKFYGTTRKWKQIYEENKNVIKDPDKVYPGLVIKIPSLP